jgi:hypothetical protein
MIMEYKVTDQGNNFHVAVASSGYSPQAGRSSKRNAVCTARVALAIEWVLCNNCLMQCPKCQSENFETDKPCPQCGFQGDANRLDELGLSLPSFTPEEAENAWIELAHLETLFQKVDEWRNAGYFKKEMEALDPVKMQRVHADELRQRLEEYPRPEPPQTDQDLLKTVNFLLDNIDLLASRQWFKSKKEIEKVVAPITAMMMDTISGNEPE